MYHGKKVREGVSKGYIYIYIEREREREGERGRERVRENIELV